MTIDHDAYVQALVHLHLGVGREGPGDTVFAEQLLAALPDVPSDTPIADLGCGSGVASVMLAKHYRRKVVCVDLAEPFLNKLRTRATEAGVADLTTCVQADMGGLDPEQYQFGLVWSEGAAYNLTFDGALRAWRPLLAPGGCLVVSELSWFTDAPPGDAAEFWGGAYPTMRTERANTDSARAEGFEVMFVERLPSKAWWENYYTPLLARADHLESGADETMRLVIAQVREEVDVFGRFSDDYGYTFYGLQSTP